MLKQVSLWFFVCGGLLFASKARADNNWVTACTSILWAPYNWETPTTIKGVGSEVAKRFFASQNTELRLVVVGSWARCLKSVELGNIDIVISAYKTEQRAKFGVYVDEPMATDNTYIVINHNNHIDYTDLSSLRKYQGGGIRGSSYGERFDKFINTLNATQWVNVRQAEQNVKKLILGRLDYTIMNPWNLKVILAQLNQRGELPGNTKIHPIGDAVTHNNLYFVFSKRTNKYPLYGVKMKQFIKQLKQSGQMQQIIEQSFKEYQALISQSDNPSQEAKQHAF